MWTEIVKLKLSVAVPLLSTQLGGHSPHCFSLLMVLLPMLAASHELLADVAGRLITSGSSFGSWRCSRCY